MRRVPKICYSNSKNNISNNEKKKKKKKKKKKRSVTKYAVGARAFMRESCYFGKKLRKESARSVFKDHLYRLQTFSCSWRLRFINVNLFYVILKDKMKYESISKLVARHPTS